MLTVKNVVKHLFLNTKLRSKIISVFTVMVLAFTVFTVPVFANTNQTIESLPAWATTYPNVNTLMLPKHSGAYTVGVTLNVDMQLTGNPTYWNSKTFDSELYKYGYNLFWNSKTGDTYSFKGTDAKAVLYWYNTGFPAVPEYDRYILVYLYNYYGNWDSVDAGYYNNSNNTYYNETSSVTFKSGTYTFALIPANNLTDRYGTALRFNGGNWDISGTLPNNSSMPGSLWLAYSAQLLYVPSNTDVTDLLAHIDSDLHDIKDYLTDGDQATQNERQNARDKIDEFTDRVNELNQAEDNLIGQFDSSADDMTTTVQSFGFGSYVNAVTWIAQRMTSFHNNASNFQALYIFPMLMGIALFIIGGGFPKKRG